MKDGRRWNEMRNWTRFRCIIAVFITVLSAFGTAAADDSVRREYQLKAAFVYKFLGFIEWADEVKAGEPKSREICVIGSNPFADILTQLSHFDKSSQMNVSVRELSTLGEASGCNLLYVSTSEVLDLRDIISSLSDSDVVTVSDIPGFVGEGGTIELYNEGNHIRFTINPERVRSHGVQISAQLLALQSERGHQ